MPTRLSAAPSVLSFRIHVGSVCTSFGPGYPCAFRRRSATAPVDALRRHRKATASAGGLDLERAGGASSGIGDPGGQCLDVAGRTADDGGGADGRR
jgi:hypothetical protein